ncbi:MAG: DUF4301 family protein [Bacteroidales bacterium]|jgi:hypothetical protein|nr:DUF4301 family protein [Bacteroidales bacterium]MDD2205546.1 DUF4301 family protein [Bacteroidales bacterium]MDD3151700.1 DUF4301 family protein [Bacteroidales bacterium]MDD3914220.1 DUF4301 family protein [Bacteroidales bacterium]MDD4634803.1 DUF4301 family protein [Bacteroidales bacterium]
MFTEKDIAQIKDRNMTTNKVLSQINIFKSGIDFIKLDKAATKPDDIVDVNDSISVDNQNVKTISFIPASGAASRMFQTLLNTLNEINAVGEDNFVLQKDNSFQSTCYFFDNIKKFAFYESLKKALAVEDYNIDILLSEHKYKTVLEYLLDEQGLNYAHKPKALLLFHNDGGRIKYAFEEHIIEAANYHSGDSIYLHYTLSPEHVDNFKAVLKDILPYYENKFNSKIDISISVQSPSTDTVAVNPDNSLFRNTDGSLLFRPGGHGALIYNLNNIDADVILIKNIDNVVPDSKKDIIVKYRKLLINNILHLFNERNKIIRILSSLDSSDVNAEKTIFDCEKFITGKLHVFLADNYPDKRTSDKIQYLIQVIDKPMRICAMVKNEGEPGGGPFVVSKNDCKSLQIVESSQINHKNDIQEAVFRSSTHFNPVDIVCMTKNAEGERYNLADFIDHDTAFISSKSKDGKPLKALELPGLWNGAMSRWITIFADVPVETFNPVKTVNDLLREAHRNV